MSEPPAAPQGPHRPRRRHRRGHRARDRAPRLGAAAPIPRWLFALGLLVALEPPVLIVAVGRSTTDLADGHLLAIALVGGLFISLPSLAILGLAVIWDRRLSGGADRARACRRR